MADVKRIIATLALAVPAFFLVWAAYGAFGSLASNGATSQNMISGGLCIAIPLLVTILVYALLRSEFKDFQLQGRHYVLAIIFVVLSILLIKSFESIHFGDPAFLFAVVAVIVCTMAAISFFQFSPSPPLVGKEAEEEASALPPGERKLNIDVRKMLYYIGALIGFGFGTWTWIEFLQGRAGEHFRDFPWDPSDPSSLYLIFFFTYPFVLLFLITQIIRKISPKKP